MLTKIWPASLASCVVKRRLTVGSIDTAQFLTATLAQL